MPSLDDPPTIPQLTRTLAERHGDAELIVLDSQRLSYREAEARSAQLARALLSRGVGKGTRVGLLMPNGPDWVVAWLAATRLGAVLVPLNTFFQTRELQWILRHADVHNPAHGVRTTQSRLSDKAGSSGPGTHRLRSGAALPERSSPAATGHRLGRVRTRLGRAGNRTGRGHRPPDGR